MEINRESFLAGIPYPDELLEGRLQIEGNVIACIWKDILLLDDNALDRDSFITRDGRFLFMVASDLRNKHIHVLDEVSVLSNSSNEVLKRFQSLGGYEAVENMVAVVNLDNWDTYLDQLNRENLLCHLYTNGFNLTRPIPYKKQLIVPIEVFRKMTTEQVLDFYELLLTEFDRGQASSVLEEGEIKFEDDWIEKRKAEKRIGTSIATAGFDMEGQKINCFPFLSNQTLGLFKKRLSIIAGFSSAGKSTYCIGIIMALLAQGESVLLICNEEDREKFKTKFMAWLLAKYCRYYNLTKNKIDSGNINDTDRKYLKIAMDYFNENYKNKLYFIGIEVTDIALIRKKIRTYALKYGITAFLIDTFKLGEKDINAQRQDLSLVRDSRELYRLAMKYDLIGLATVQLAEHMRGTLSLTASALSNSKQIKETVELLLMMRPAYDEELDPKSRWYCRPFVRRKNEAGVWVEETYEADPTCNYRILSVEKNRNGQDTAGNGESFLLKFDGAHSVFREVAFCRTKHGMIQ